MAFDINSLVTDRAEADVAALEALEAVSLDQWTAEQLAEFNRSRSKGTYGFTDLNRVTACMDYLNGFFEQYGYITGYAPVSMEAGRTVWRESDGPYADLLEQYRANVAKLRAVLTLRPDTPAVPADMAGLTTEEANNIEKILIEIDTIIGWLEASFDRSHAYTFWSGSDPLPSAESDLGRIWAELDAMNTTWNNWQAADFYLLLYGNLKAEGGVA